MFDVVITTRNRPKLLSEAIESCLFQGTDLHKVVVVFDPDDDETAALASAVNDPRVYFHRLAVRGGICGARRAGFAIADAEWTVHIDDDWELRPGALAKFAAMAAQASPEIVMLGARILWTNGRETPLRVPDQSINYIEQLQWRNRPDGLGTDNLCCLHKKVRDSGVNWMPELAGGCTEIKFYLDAARCGLAWYTSDLLALEKPIRESNSRGSWAHRLALRERHAASYVQSLHALLVSHGSGLRVHAGSLYAGCLQAGAMCELLRNRQRESLKLAMMAFTHAPSGSTMGMLLLALCGRRSLEFVYRLRG